MKIFYTYILKCSDDSYYIGITNSINRRLKEHQDGYDEASYTHNRRPVELVYTEVFQYPMDAINREKQLKKWSRAKKEALINLQEKELKQLAKKEFKK